MERTYPFGKRLGSFLLALAFTLALLPAFEQSARAAITDWSSLQSALDAGGTVTLTQNITAAETDGPLTVSGTVTLDLKGYTIDRNQTQAASNGYAIGVSGSLTVQDTSTNQDGRITGGRTGGDGYGGGVYVGNGGTLTVNSGEISGNASVNGGGVYIANGAAFTMTGGEISGNTGNGGGVYVNGSGTFQISGGAKVRGNTGIGNNAGKANNVWLDTGAVITVADALADGAEINVTNGVNPSDGAVAAQAGGSHTITSADAAKIVGNNAGFVTVLEDGAVKQYSLATALTKASTDSAGPTLLTLGADCTLNAALTVASGTYVTLDLNGHILDRGLTAAASNGHVIGVLGNLTIQDSDPTAAHTPAITYHDPVADEDVTVTGGVITGGYGTGYGGNTGSMVGGGVCVCNTSGANATVTMTGGTIVGNRADQGAGVYIGYNRNGSSSATFTMNGGKICGNDGEGVYPYAGAIVLGGTAVITGNTGAGVTVNGTLTMSGSAVISNNGNGGVDVSNGSTFTMNNGTIQNNRAQNGGGVYLSGYDDGAAALIMNGGSITGNNAVDTVNSPGCGGGVYGDKYSAISLNGGSITSNTANGRGGGIYKAQVDPTKYSDFENSFTVRGDVNVSGNTANGSADNVCLAAADEYDDQIDAVITVTGALGSSASIGVTRAGTPAAGAVVARGIAASENTSAYTLTAADAAKFSYDGDSFAVSLDSANNKLVLGAAPNITTWAGLQTALNAGGTVKLTQNVTAASTDAALTIGVTVTLDLNGCTIDRGLTSESPVENGYVIRVDGGNLTLKDTSAAQTGKITGGSNSNSNNAYLGGGVSVYGGTFVMDGGIITGNYQGSDGGGVSVVGGPSASAAFTMNGGEIKNNASGGTGGVKVGVHATFTMNGGKITGSSGSSGGSGGRGVSVDADSDESSSFNPNPAGGKFIMTGGEISGSSGEGVFLDHAPYAGERAASFTMSGGTITGNGSGGVRIGYGNFSVSGSVVITDNHASDGTTNQNVLIQFADYSVTVAGALTSSASIGVSTATAPTDAAPVTVAAASGYTLTESDAAKFFGDSGKAVVLDGGALKLVNKTPWAALNDKLAAGGTVTLYRDCTASADDSPLTVADGVTVTLDLNGKTLTANNTMSASTRLGSTNMAILVQSGGALTVKDTGTGGKINGSGATYGVYLDDGTATACPSFTLEGGTISGCSSYGVKIMGGDNSSYQPTFTMTGGTISGNTRGGVTTSAAVYSLFNMSGGTITGNGGAAGSADYNYGGVYISGGTFTMSGGSITANGGTYGGVCLFADIGTCVLNMSGGSITNNTGSVGGGVYVNRNTSNAYPYTAQFRLSGSPTISGNTANGAANNVCLIKGGDVQTVIDVAGALTSAASIGVTRGGTPAAGDTVAQGYTPLSGSAYTLTASDAEKFSYDGDSFELSFNSAGSMLVLAALPTTVTTWTALKSALVGDGTGSAETISVTLGGDVDDDIGTIISYLEVPSGKTVTLDLSGHTINRDVYDDPAPDGFVIRVASGGTLTVKDTGTGGKITGGWRGGSGDGNGGGVYVAGGGAFTLESGSISGNRAVNGGGVYVEAGGTFTLKGGAVTGNRVSESGRGGGIFVASDGTTSGVLNIQGSSTVTGNETIDSETNNLYLNPGAVVTVTGALTSAASIGVTLGTGYTGAFTSGLSGKGAAANFTSDAVTKHVELNALSEAVLADGAVVGSWSALQAALNAGGTVTLAQNVTAASGDAALTIGSGVTVTLDLNGKTISGSGTVAGTSTQVANMAVFVSGGSLTVTDGASGGRIAGYTGSGTNAGVCVGSGSFTLSGGTIDGSQNGSSASTGVFVEGGTFTMSGGEISGNTRSSSGVGVSLVGGAFTMTGGKIQNNQTTGGSSSGAGVYVYSGTFTMSGGEISGNKANAAGAGVLVASGGTFNLSGSPTLSGNTRLDNSTTPSNVCLASGKVVTVTGALTNTTPIGVTLASGFTEGGTVAVGGTPAGGSAAYELTSADAAKLTAEASGQYFTYNAAAKTLTFFASDPSVIDTPAKLIAALTSTGAGTVTLAADMVVDKTTYGGGIRIDSEKTLRLNGHTYVGVDFNITIENGGVLTVEGPGTMSLTTVNSYGNSTLFIVRSTGTLVLKDGTSDANVSGGVQILGVPYAIAQGNTFITNNTDIPTKDRSVMTGVSLNNGGTLKVSGNPVVRGNMTDGSNADGRKNIVLNTGAVITIDGTLGAQAWLGVDPLATVAADTPVVITSGYGGVLENDKFHVGYTASTADYVLSSYATANGLELAVFYSEDYIPTAVGRCTGASVYWMLSRTGGLTVTGSGAIPDYAAKGAPWFNYRHKIKTVCFDDAITRIGNYAFYACGALQTVTVGSSGAAVGDRAFAYCCALRQIVAESGSVSFASAGEGAFYACFALSDTARPAITGTVGSKAFELCGLVSEH